MSETERQGMSRVRGPVGLWGPRPLQVWPPSPQPGSHRLASGAPPDVSALASFIPCLDGASCGCSGFSGSQLHPRVHHLCSGLGTAPSSVHPPLTHPWPLSWCLVGAASGLLPRSKAAEGEGTSHRGTSLHLRPTSRGHLRPPRATAFPSTFQASPPPRAHCGSRLTPTQLLQASSPPG